MKNKKIVTQWTSGALLAGISLLSLPASAQNVESLDSGVSTPAPVEQVQPADHSGLLPVTVSSGVSEQFNTSINTDGSFSLTRFKAGVRAPVRLNDDFVLGTTFRYQLDSYDFQSSPDYSWHNINTLAVSSILAWRVDDVWSVYGGGFVRLSAESSASLGDGVNGGGVAGFNYKVDDTLRVGAGLAVISVLEDSARVLPILTAKWKFDEDFRLDLGLADIATMGYGADLKWFFNPELEFTLGVQYHRSRFRVGQDNSIGQEQATTVFVGPTWHACPNMDVTGYVGLAAGGQLRAEDSAGQKTAQSDYSTAAVLGLNASVRF